MKEISEDHHKAYIRQLIYENNVLEAIKYIRELTGLGLKESKELCNIFLNDLSKLDEYSFFSENTAEIEEFSEYENAESGDDIVENIKIMLQNGEKLLAVKFAKEVLNIGLKEAKSFVENLEEEEKNSELIIAGENNDLLIEQNLEKSELPEIEDPEATLELVLCKKNIRKKSQNTYRSSETITFGKIAEREKNRKKTRSNSGCMITLMILLLITISLAGSLFII